MIRFPYKKLFIFLIALSIFPIFLSGQETHYDSIKQIKLAEESPFQKIINGELEARIVFEDEEIIAFYPLREQAPVHLLIVPKKRITTINEIREEDSPLLGKMIYRAKELAQEMGIAESGYRLVFNTNQDSGQSVFHIHLHLIGGKDLGPMVDQE